MQISSSSRTVNNMKVTLQKVTREMDGIQDTLRNTMAAVSGWNDQQGMQYKELMRQVAKLTESPKGTLLAAIPKLDRMMQALQAYEKIKF